MSWSRSGARSLSGAPPSLLIYLFLLFTVRRFSGPGRIKLLLSRSVGRGGNPAGHVLLCGDWLFVHHGTSSRPLWC